MGKTEDPREHLDPSETFSPDDFYVAACETLLKQGRFGRDQHSYGEEIEIENEDGTLSNGRYLLGDYFRSGSVAYKSAEEQEGFEGSAKKLLADKTTVLGIRLYGDKDKTTKHEGYFLFKPSMIEPNSLFAAWLGADFIKRYTLEAVFIVTDKHEIISNPSKVPQLRKIYQTLLHPKVQSSHPSPSVG
jgi:hypothetical protein